MFSPFRVGWRFVFATAALSPLVGCPLEAQSNDKPEDTACAPQLYYADADADGFGNVVYSIEACESPPGYIANSGDCNDLAPNISPGASELCDTLDNDCDGTVDISATDAPFWYLDQDGDTYGDDALTVAACAAPDGYVATGGDCDDLDSASLSGATWFVDGDLDGFGGEAIVACDHPAGTVATGGDCDDLAADIHPDAPEYCNGLDDDCDFATDEDSVDFETFFVDNDADGYGSDDESVEACEPPDGFVDNESDCDDTNSAIHPTAEETCSSVDEDCDGLIDAADPDAVGVPVWYQDADGDSYGATGLSVAECTQPTGYVPDADDCDDAAGTVFPGAPETCDGADQNCDGNVDESALDATIWYADLDADGYGDVAVTILSCELPAGYADNGDDCNDVDGEVYPSAPETCDNEDDDCDGVLDNDPVDLLAWYADRDGDGFGNSAETESACSAPEGFVGEASDCNDGSAAQNPAAVESCSGVDEDCDGLVDGDDPDMTGLATWYLDEDGDQHGVATTFTSACARPDGYALDGDDCDDSNAYAFPGADETCDGTDEDCDGDIDESALDAPTWYADLDSDGYGDDGVVVLQCEEPAGYVDSAGDCDDTEALTSPEGVETCDGTDEDCDGSIDEKEWYADADGDSFGDVGALDTTCVMPTGYVADWADCDDRDATVSPDGTEVCGGTDEDCDGLFDDADDTVIGKFGWYADTDADGWGAGAEILACAAPSGTTGVSGDCDDSTPDVSPDGVEVCGGGDEDCDSLIDDADPDATELVPWFVDADLDGYGTGTAAVESCAQPVGHAATNDDCDDLANTISPGAYEVCADGIDQDCDGADVTNCDPDGDGYDVSVDCDETNPDINPGEREVCDAANTDEDCDGLADNDDSSAYAPTKTRFYRDTDADTFGDDDHTGTLLCDATVGYAESDDDCDDADAAISPGENDVCDDGIDNDCSGQTDDCLRWRLDEAATVFSGAAGEYFGAAVAAGDFDGDGVGELVITASAATVASPADGAAYIFDGTMRGSVDPTMAITALYGSGGNGFGSEAAAGDVDGDGMADLLVRMSPFWHVMSGPDAMLGGLGLYGYGARGMASLEGTNTTVADLDGDEIDDVLAISSSASASIPVASVYLSPSLGERTITAADLVFTNGNATVNYPAMDDLDGDGLSDVMLGIYGGETYSLLAPFSSSTALSAADAIWSGSGKYLLGMCTGELTGDGYVDAVWGTSGVTYLVPGPLVSANAAVSAIATASFVHVNAEFNACETGDFDGDTGGDVFLGMPKSGSDLPSVYALTGPWVGAQTPDTIGFPGVGASFLSNYAYDDPATALAVSDIDGDGADDVILSGQPGAYMWLGAEMFP